ncbi:hypothetical protein GALMADRAFT_819675 [Galerina marginata CBS 339.88]|uniref:Uncharacterized protein n=1 Tax=Galerina marginata (strain CBS 339.88) TaxID=685588 RepID=A0A067TJ56_GALM3|nr:hypothetical protein GALMADRAFT_819675 [Galerina marginata CBS 339.88]
MQCETIDESYSATNPQDTKGLNESIRSKKPADSLAKLRGEVQELVKERRSFARFRYRSLICNRGSEFGYNRKEKPVALMMSLLSDDRGVKVDTCVEECFSICFRVLHALPRRHYGRVCCNVLNRAVFQDICCIAKWQGGKQALPVVENIKTCPLELRFGLKCFLHSRVSRWLRDANMPFSATQKNPKVGQAKSAERGLSSGKNKGNWKGLEP